VSRLEWVGVASVAFVLLATAASWVMFGLAGLRLNHPNVLWQFDAAPVALFGIGGGLLLLTTATVLLAVFRPNALRGWQITGTVVVLAMLGFVATLLVMRGIDHWDWGERQQIRRFLIASWMALAITFPSLGLMVFLRRSPNALVSVWLVIGTLVALVGLVTWMEWTYPIP
jgi:hypothetical protein